MNARLHKIEKRGALYFIIGLNGKAVGLGHMQREDAEESLRDLLRSSQRSIRSCMTCQRTFESEGSHNRMCLECKKAGV